MLLIQNIKQTVISQCTFKLKTKATWFQHHIPY